MDEENLISGVGKRPVLWRNNQEEYIITYLFLNGLYDI